VDSDWPCIPGYWNGNHCGAFFSVTRSFSSTAACFFDAVFGVFGTVFGVLRSRVRFFAVVEVDFDFGVFVDVDAVEVNVVVVVGSSIVSAANGVGGGIPTDGIGGGAWIGGCEGIPAAGAGGGSLADGGGAWIGGCGGIPADGAVARIGCCEGIPAAGAGGGTPADGAVAWIGAWIGGGIAADGAGVCGGIPSIVSAGSCSPAKMFRDESVRDPASAKRFRAEPCTLSANRSYMGTCECAIVLSPSSKNMFLLYTIRS